MIVKTMDDQYGDGSDHEVCRRCGMCVTCGDCKQIGCGTKGEISDGAMYAAASQRAAPKAHSQLAEKLAEIFKRPNAKSEGADAALSRTLPLD